MDLQTHPRVDRRHRLSSLLDHVHGPNLHPPGHLVRPNEQKQIVRIILFAPVFAIFNFFALWIYDVSWILLPFPELYECFALVAMFYLMVLYVSPDEENRKAYFHHLQRLGRYSQKAKHDRGSLRWFQVTWVLVFQILPAKLAINAAEWHSVLPCAQSNMPTQKPPPSSVSSNPSSLASASYPF